MSNYLSAVFSSLSTSHSIIRFMNSLLSLPMYDLPELFWATDAWFDGLCKAWKRQGLEARPVLNRCLDNYDLWLSPNLLCSQTCGYPLQHRLKGKVRLLGTPAYRAPGCSGFYYRSAIMVAATASFEHIADLKGCVCAFNSTDSQSGYNALRDVIAPYAEYGTFFTGLKEMGAHADSLMAVGQGEAQVCAVDCVSLALYARYRPGLTEGLRILGYTEAAPCLPYITAKNIDEPTLRCLQQGILTTFQDPDLASVRTALLLDGFYQTEIEDYQIILDMEYRAAQQGYAVLGRW